jgi:hypothetical protein
MHNPFDIGTAKEVINQTASENDPPAIPNVFTVNSGSPTINFEPPPSPLDPEPIIETVQSNISSEKRKFNIADLYWFRNLKPMYNQALADTEATVLVISYNADFENLRLCFSKSQDTGRTISVLPGARQNSANIFSETCREILTFVESINQNTKFPYTITNYERVFNLNNPNWAPNDTIIKFINHQVIEIYTKLPSGEIQSFTLVSWQVKAFIDVCRFMTNGQSWSLKIHSTIHKD